MLKSLIICYIIIVIVQVIITIYTEPYESKTKRELEARIKYNLEHKDEILKKFGEKILEIAKPINSDKMGFDEWLTWVNTLPPLETGGNKYYYTIWEQVIQENGEEDYVLIHYGDPKYEGLNYKDFRDEIYEIAINAKHLITNDSSRYAIETGGIGKVDGFVYYWLDPLSQQSVKKESVNTIFRDKNGKHGYISAAIDLEDLSETNSFKYYTHIRPITLFITSIMTISVSIIIYNLNAMKYSNIRAIVFLFVSNIYLRILDHSRLSLHFCLVLIFIYLNHYLIIKKIILKKQHLFLAHRLF